MSRSKSTSKTTVPPSLTPGHGLAIKIDYDRYHNCEADPSSETVAGLEEFRHEIEKEYITVVHKHLIGRGGNVYDFTVQLLTNVHLSDVSRWLLQGVAFDVLKWGTTAFVLRPFLDAFGRLRQREQQYPGEVVDIGELTITFQDSTVIIRKVRGVSFFDSLEKILQALAVKHEALLRGGSAPFMIYIPIFEDCASNRIIRFRQLLSVDETIAGVGESDYFKFWGVRYGYCENRVFDVERSLLIDEGFFTESEYWAAWERRRSDKKIVLQKTKTGRPKGRTKKKK